MSLLISQFYLLFIFLQTAVHFVTGKKRSLNTSGNYFCARTCHSEVNISCGCIQLGFQNGSKHSVYKVHLKHRATGTAKN